MKTMNQEQFKQLVSICRSYDPFTQYIDNYKQQLSAEASNKKLAEKFAVIMEDFGVERSFIPCTNDGPDTENNLKQWLGTYEITVEEKVIRVWTEQEIKNLIQTNDKVLCSSLIQLYNCQTADEQSSAETTHANGRGFNALDAEFLTSVSKFFLKNKFLTDKQKAIVRKKLVKYTKQITELANAHEEAKR